MYYSPTSVTITKLKLADDLMYKVADGSKKCTIRRGRRSVKRGMLLLEATNGTHPDLIVNITAAFSCTCVSIPESIVKDAGYEDAGDCYLSLRRFYPDLKMDEVITVIMWE
jgi:hypothetical protein